MSEQSAISTITYHYTTLSSLSAISYQLSFQVGLHCPVVQYSYMLCIV